MITFSNIKRYDNIDFDEYLKMPGYSHSWLKSEENGQVAPFIETYKVTLGKLVDAILTEPDRVDMNHPQYPHAAIIATKINMMYGPAIKRFQKQVSFTADMNLQNHSMPAKFRLDYLLPDYLVLDLKVTHEKVEKIPALVVRMGYTNQLWGYTRVANVKNGYLLFYSVPSNSLQIIGLPTDEKNSFWASKIYKFGRVAA